MLTILEAIVLGIVQGLAEWLPISSEGMTTLVMLNFFGKTLSDALPIAIWLHTGTLLSAIVYFRKDILRIIADIPQYVKSRDIEEKKSSIITFLLITTAITGIIGLPLILFATNGNDFSGRLATAIIGGLLIFTGLLQMSAAKRTIHRETTGIVDAVIVGITQGFSALPGVSRSGITVSTLILRNIEPAQALRLSFLMSIPAVLAANVGMEAMGLLDITANSIVALIFAFVTGILTIDLFIKAAKKIDFSKFCIALGLLSILAYFVG
ncbi:undecaprenyl-diphosphate phosphatase [Methanolobus sediminis]|uniref:Undecaprenyl-diphosphatase n=1 Tax=Methanolobus sediminis TaxID=3072978 RepID=A0AA51UIK8_9EURY|nr:undecaprenyl-diphosphate phosphatase [Methanolobus sediminis]WMW24233.1 undecaprenyl-diphosphate phosphatase [Methanolobus sediminis]